MTPTQREQRVRTAMEAEPRNGLEALEFWSRLPLVPPGERGDEWTRRRAYLETMMRPSTANDRAAEVGAGVESR
jgi:hypothetical protein